MPPNKMINIKSNVLTTFSTKFRLNGSALLTALFIMTLVAIVATAMSTKVQVDIYRTNLIVTHDKLYLASQAVTFWALSELNDNKNKFNKADPQGAVSHYPLDMKNIDDTVTLSGALYDLQSRYNLNNLANKKSTIGFMNLIGAVLPLTTDTEKLALANAVSDWIANYDLAKGKDIYLSYYMQQAPPYYPSHQLMGNASELRLVKDVSAASYLALQPFITVLPEFTRVNLNTAPMQVLKTLSNITKETQLNELILARKENGIKNMAQISETLKKLDIANDQISLESNYFLSLAYASSDHLTLAVYTLFQRTRDKNNKLSVHVIRESFNIF